MMFKNTQNFKETFCKFVNNIMVLTLYRITEILSGKYVISFATELETL